MLSFGKILDDRASMEAINASMAVAELKPNGTIARANDIFCKIFGYQLPEMAGRHHDALQTSENASRSDPEKIWALIVAGTLTGGQQRYVAKNGREIWLEVSYIAVRQSNAVSKILIIATDITGTKTSAGDSISKFSAISRSQAIIEFTPQGEILDANSQFCDAIGYR